MSSETGAPDCVTIDAQGAGRVFHCINADGATQLIGLTITNGVAGGYLQDGGAGLRCDHSDIRVRHCIFVANNSLEGRGGGVECEYSNAVLEHVSFVDNVAGLGGGVACYDSDVSIAMATFTGNFADEGGGFWSVEGSPHLQDVTFSGNSAVSGGAAYSSSRGSPVFEGAVFTGNHASENGGAMLSSFGSRPVISSARFDGNTAVRGGALFIHYGSSPALTNVVLTGNSAEWGGAVFCRQVCFPDLERVQFVDNTAVHSGGAFHLGPNAMATLSNVGFTGNEAVVSGGAICCRAATLAVQWAEFHSNSALVGGASHSEGGSAAFQTCTFWENAASAFGGAISIELGTTMILESSTLVGNAAPSGGGLFCASGANATLSNTIIAFTSNGGAARCQDATSQVLPACCDIFGNTGGDWDGCIAGAPGVAGNLSDDPIFCDADEGDFTISCDSPCALEYGSFCGLIGAWGVGCGATGLSPASWSSIKARYR